MRLLQYAVCQLKQAYIKKKAFCYVTINKEVLGLLRVLKMLGFVGGVIKTKFGSMILLRYRKNKTGLRNLNLFSKKSNRVYFSNKEVKGLHINGYYKTSAVVMYRTSRSEVFLTGPECLILGVGGEPAVVVG